MDIGFVTCNPKERLTFARENNFKHIEIDGPFFHESNRSPEIGGRDISLSFHAPLELSLAVQLEDLMAANTHYYRKLIDLAEKTDAEWITLHLGVYLSYFLSEEQALDLSISSLKELTSYAEKKRIILAVENFRNSRKDPYPYFQLGTKIEDFEKIFGVIGSPYLKICFDVGHANITSRNPIEYIKTLGGKIHSVHVHDNFGEEDNHLPCGYGNIKWGEIIQELKKSGFNGKLVIENGDNPEIMLSSKKFLENLIQ
jgi:sugar phosphate isomerase/epimerase